MSKYVEFRKNQEQAIEIFNKKAINRWANNEAKKETKRGFIIFLIVFTLLSSIYKLYA